jgi:hypothetical protein
MCDHQIPAAPDLSAACANLGWLEPLSLKYWCAVYTGAIRGPPFWKGVLRRSRHYELQLRPGFSSACPLNSVTIDAPTKQICGSGSTTCLPVCPFSNLLYLPLSSKSVALAGWSAFHSAPLEASFCHPLWAEMPSSLRNPQPLSDFPPPRQKANRSAREHEPQVLKAGASGHASGSRR